MNYLFIIDPPENLKVKKDTSIFVMKAFLKKDVGVFYTTKKNFTLRDKRFIFLDKAAVLLSIILAFEMFCLVKYSSI